MKQFENITKRLNVTVVISLLMLLDVASSEVSISTKHLYSSLVIIVVVLTLLNKIELIIL